MADFHDSLDDALDRWRTEWTEADLYRSRPDVPGHTMTKDTAGAQFVIRCECGWVSDPLHLSNIVAAENRHRIEVAP
jgi:hypothetical protein